MNNLTGRNQTRIQEPLCQHGIYGTHQKMLLSVLNIPISITAFLGNVLIIVALKRVSSIHLPSKLLLSCLATTDLCVGLITNTTRVRRLHLDSRVLKKLYLSENHD